MSAEPVSEEIALTAHAAPDDIVAWRSDGAVSQARFLADVDRLAAMLPAGGSMLNVCDDRYRFMVGLAAGLVAGKVNLLPSSHTPEAVRQLRDYAADVFCLHDGNGGSIDLPRFEFPSSPPAERPLAMPRIEASRVAAVLLTSGSTGSPMPHAKTWGSLFRNGRAEAERLGFLARGHAIVGTVPAQHSYGLESTVLLTLHGGCTLWSGRPFYPADIASALAAVPRPRLLVTTPFHLRTLLDSGVDLPPLDMILSATAPLPEALARAAEARTGAPLHEIYGCTETGQLASRRTTAGPAWRPFPGIRLEQEDGVTFASGGQVHGRQALADAIELMADGSFMLRGRNADMVNIAGRRTSLGYLDHQLASIAGVEDGAFFMPDEADGGAASGEGITRLAAFVVAPSLTPRQLLDALRSRIDTVFLPRPLVFLECLPRNATGKLPRRELQALLVRRDGGNA